MALNNKISTGRHEMSWKAFEEDAPELARLSYEKLNRKIAYLATLKQDGAPRLHPVTPFIGNGLLFIFTEPSSPKIRDLQRDGRYVLHCAVDREGPLLEVQISGEARVVTDRQTRQSAERLAASAVVIDRYYLFEFLVERVLVVQYDKAGIRTVHHWPREKGGES
jgi:hypothetical protein